MSEMVERVARAVHAAQNDAPYPWWHSDPSKCVLSQHVARAALQAMREPTVAMIDAAHVAYHKWNVTPQRKGTGYEASYRAMISAALQDTGQ